jgi:hypothetical protein
MGWLAAGGIAVTVAARPILYGETSDTRHQEAAMAQKTTVTLQDDLDGGPGDETVQFAIGGTGYEIDLSASNAARASPSRCRTGCSAPLLSACILPPLWAAGIDSAPMICCAQI